MSEAISKFEIASFSFCNSLFFNNILFHYSSFFEWHGLFKAKFHQKMKNHPHCQYRFDSWREKYNCQRPHEAIGFEFPASRYKQSVTVYPEVLPPIEYDSSDIIRKVMQHGLISFNNQVFKVGKAFIGDRVALRAGDVDGLYQVYFCNQIIRSINLHEKV